MHWWKTYPPGWFAWEWEPEEEEEEDDDSGGGDEEEPEEEPIEQEDPGDFGGDFGDDSGDFGEDVGGGDDDSGDGDVSDFADDPWESDGDSGDDNSWEREWRRDRERQEAEDRQREIEREWERQQEEERRRLEEEERQREIARREAELEDLRRRQEAAAVWSKDLGLDVQQPGVPEPGAPTQPVVVRHRQTGQQFVVPREQAGQYSISNEFEIFDPEDRAPEGASTPPPGAQQGDTAPPGYTGLFTPPPEAQTPPPSPAAEPPAKTAPEQAAAIAAAGAAAAGAPAEAVVQAAETAARIASDRQSLAEQTPWTRAAFRSQYGDRANEEWVRQHEAELQRNVALYGSREPTPGATPLAAAPAGTPVAPNRRIGGVSPPTADETGLYGVNQPQVQVKASATSAPALGAAPPATAPAGAAPVAPAAPAANGWVPVPGQGPPRYLPPPPAAQNAGAGLGETPAATARPAQPASAPTSLSPTTPRSNAAINNMIRGIPADTRAVDAGPRESGPLPAAPPPPTVTAEQARQYYEGGVNPATGDIDIQSSLPSPAVGEGRPETDMPVTDDRGLPVVPGYETPTPPVVPAPSRTPVPLSQTDVETIPGRLTPLRNIVQTDAQGNPVETSLSDAQYGAERYASTDTSLTPVTSIEQARESRTPLDALASLALHGRGDPAIPDTIRRDSYNIAHGVSALLQGKTDAQGRLEGAWAEPYLNDVARLAWSREEAQNGRDSDPRDTPVEYVERWKDAFYGSDANVPLVKELDQQMIDYGAARTPVGQPFRWQDVYGPNGDKGLVSKQITGVDCGPNAFSTIMRSRGYNATPAETFSFVRTFGSRYHDGNQFQGPGAMVDLVNKQAGLQAEQVALNEQGWAAVDAELAAGRPVMLSGPGHWWAVSAKSPDGKYYAGATALGAGEGGWLKRGGFVFNGAANAAVLVRGEVAPDAPAVRTMGLKPPGTVARNTRDALSGQTVMATPGQAQPEPRTQRLNEQTSGADAQSIVQAPPSPRANLAPRFTVQETTEMRNRILNEMPDVRFESNDDADTRLRKMVPALEWVEKEYGFSAEALAGMAVNESNVGTAPNAPAGKANNLWSVQYMPSDSQSTGPIPQGRWAAYPSVKAAMARFIGMYAHPENGYRYTWQDRNNPDKLLDALVKDKYVVDEPGFPVSDWYRGVNAGRQRYRKVRQEVLGR